jgi:hypothetical protein
MSRQKGIKRTRNHPVFYTELKKQRSLNLTDTAWSLLDKLSLKEGISKSEVVERIIRNLEGS